MTSEDKGITNDVIIGIDLGTTNSCVAVWRKNHFDIIPDSQGRRTLPSFVAYTNTTRYVGHDAKNQKELNPHNVFYDVKRLIGRKFNDPIVESERNFFSFKIDKDENDNIVLVPKLDNKNILTPEEISATILSKLKRNACDYLGVDVKKCIITVPAYFNDGQRQATKDAAKIAGLDCVRLINEPTAAALAFGMMERTQNKTRHVIVYDFGGGTLDVSLVKIVDGIFEVLASCGNSRLGGSDFDTRLMSYCLGKFAKKYSVNIETIEIPSISYQKLKLDCERVKKNLSILNKDYVIVKNFYNDLDMIVPITRTEFEKICMDLFLICLKPIDDVLKNCNMSPEQIDDILMVGGMTRMPKLKELIELRMGKKPNCSKNPDEVVAAGAAVQGYILANKESAFSENISLLDSTSLSLGVEVHGGHMDVIIPRNTTLPASKTKRYTTNEDYVDSVLIKIYEGERKAVKDNFFVGEFLLEGLEPLIRGSHKILVSFNVDENGIITVSAENAKTNDSAYITVTSNKGRLSPEKLEALIEEAREMEAYDELMRYKKTLYYEIDEFCDNIIGNLENDLVKLTAVKKAQVMEEVLAIQKNLKSKKWQEYEDELLQDWIKSLKDKYGILIIEGKLTKSNVKPTSKDNHGVGIYDLRDDDENMDDYLEKLEQEEFSGLSDNEITEIKEMGKSIRDICYTLLDIITREELLLDQTELNNMKDFIDDTLLYLHVHEKPTKMDYKAKLDEINEICDKIYDSYGGNIFKETNKMDLKNKRDELENMCIATKIIIDSGAIVSNKKTILKVGLLSSLVDSTLTWLYENYDKLVEENKELYDECVAKIDEITNLSNEIYLAQNDMDLNIKINIQTPVTEIEDTKDDGSGVGGTNILSIIQNRQQNVINNMINTENPDID